MHIANGSDINEKTTTGDTALHYRYAVRYGREDTAKLLIAKGADVNAKDKYGWTPLDSAVYTQKDIVALLIRAGANVNSRHHWGETP